MGHTKHKNAKVEQLAMEKIHANEGIGSSMLTKMISEETGMNMNNVSALLFHLWKNGLFVRTRTSQKDRPTLGQYHCWTEVPPGTKASDLAGQQVHNHKKGVKKEVKKEVKENCS